MNDISDHEIKDTLTTVFGEIIKRADEERHKTEPYQMLFGTFKDKGLKEAIFDASNQMDKIVANLCDIIKNHTDATIDHDLYAVIRCLPFVIGVLKEDISKKEGLSCSSDKMRVLLRTYFYEKLQIDVETIPYNPK